MRVELIYKPGCSFYRKTLENLETVIAEERLPIPVEIVQKPAVGPLGEGTHTVRIDGDDLCKLPIEPQGEFCRLYLNKSGVSGTPCIELLRDILFGKWKELTEMPLIGLHSP